ncbi:hypothetical protein CWB96_09240 [Pseudoalteromonas citrea]|uniref:Uncharacterized protein n=1 Tax=Pseudoalteromonas citrea TaxID=43655 RepID=A0A5S3XS77_9GAMM|nr:hypothetical protein CWB97_18775 [Pseudoalteromonas citrea]TMP59546.1 hypothetical protein CWB96_09240 [Pseudoalteromonas citrea]
MFAYGGVSLIRTLAELYAALFIEGLKRAVNAHLRWFGFTWGVGGALRRAFYWGFKANWKRSPTPHFL